MKGVPNPYANITQESLAKIVQAKKNIEAP